MVSPALRARIEKIEDLSPSVRAFHLALEGGGRLEFVPGQYVTLHVSVEGKTLSHPYSIASPPRPDARFEVCVKHGRHSPGADHLWRLKPGDTLRLSGPSGTFTLPDPIERDVVFVATGTGITPFRSMIHHALPRSGARRITLLFGARGQADLLYRREWEGLERVHASFRFVPTLSRPEPAWQGRTGYVQDVTPEFLRARGRGSLGGRPGSGLDVYICGLRKMVGRVREQCREWGFPKGRVHFESYD